MRDWRTRVYVKIRITENLRENDVLFSPVDIMQFKVHWYTQCLKIIEYTFNYRFPDLYGDDFFVLMKMSKFSLIYFPALIVCCVHL